MEDIAIMCGGKAIDVKTLENDFSPEFFGKCEHGIISEFETSLFNCRGNAENIINRINILKSHAKREEDKNIKEVIQLRISKLEGKSAIIGVGGFTDAEKGENRDKIIDALNSCKSALEYGILPGGGTPYIHGLKMLEKLLINNDNNINYNAGVRVFYLAIKVIYV